MSRAKGEAREAADYTYLAWGMSGQLAVAVKEKRIREDTFKRGDLSGAQEFFASVRRCIERAHTQNSVEDTSIYNIAAYGVRAAQKKEVTSEEMDRQLSELASFINSLDRPRDLSPDEVATAELLSVVFHEIDEKGEE